MLRCILIPISHSDTHWILAISLTGLPLQSSLTTPEWDEWISALLHYQEYGS